jgi:hypothetical protein
MESPPAAEGVRLDWSAVPPSVRGAVETWAGSEVARAISQPSGFSPGVAARLRLANGQRLFLKAIGPTPNADAVRFHRREGRIVSALPHDVPVPRLRWMYDSADDGWVVLVFDEVDGDHPRQPWRLDELDRVLIGLAELADALTPSPLRQPEVRTAAQRLASTLCGWQFLRQGPAWQIERLDAWSRRHLDALADVEALAPAAVVGNTLLHFDVRADNILLARDRVWFFDWPHACIGAAYLDVVAFAPSVTMQGGPLPEAVLARSPVGRRADADAVTASLAAIAGYFTYQALQPPPPGIPTVRAFQAAQGVVAREWLARRTGWT